MFYLVKENFFTDGGGRNSRYSIIAKAKNKDLFLPVLEKRIREAFKDNDVDFINGYKTEELEEYELQDIISESIYEPLIIGYVGFHGFENDIYFILEITDEIPELI